MTSKKCFDKIKNIAYVSSSVDSSIYVVNLETMTLSKQIKITHKLNRPETLMALRKDGKFYARFSDKTGPATSGWSVLYYGFL